MQSVVSAIFMFIGYKRFKTYKSILDTCILEVEVNISIY